VQAAGRGFCANTEADTGEIIKMEIGICFP